MRTPVFVAIPVGAASRAAQSWSWRFRFADSPEADWVSQLGPPRLGGPTQEAHMAAPWLTLSAEVAAALADGRPVVALESTLIAHGLPRPANLETARAAEG